MNIYDRHPHAYDKLLSPLEKAFLGEWRKQVIGLLPSEGRIIEIGAGTGLNFRHYGNVSDLVATDLSREMLRCAHRRDARVNLVQADACRLPFENDTFSSAVGTLVLCSVREPSETFSELRRVVKTNGRMVFLEHVRPEGILGPVFDALNLATTFLIDDHFNRRTPHLLADFGFEITRVKNMWAGIVNLIECRNKK